MLSKKQVVKYLGSVTVLSSLSCSILPFLTSCSTVTPTFTVTNATQDWAKGSTVDVNAMWKGYYFDDINNPADKQDVLIEMHGHEKDIQVIKDYRYTYKWSDSNRKIQTCNIRFQILTNKEDTEAGAEPFNIDIMWTVKHSSFLKKSTITVKPYKEEIISIKEDFNYASIPDADSDIQDTSTLENNSFQAVNSIYNRIPIDRLNPPPLPSRLEISRHLTNDLIWYQYLIFNSLTYVWIDDTTGVWAKLNDASWKFSIDLEYNYTTQIFNYIKLQCSATGEAFALNGLSKGTSEMELNYVWGVQGNPLYLGPKLMGAYTSGKDGLSHFPQNFTGTNKKPDYPPRPYTQNFLSLVPSNNLSYQEYNMTIKTDTKITGKKTYDIGQHVYFLQQARFLGLEYATGQNHIQLRPDKGDSFKSWQFALPSYTLSGMSYDFAEDGRRFMQEYPSVDIKQCYVDINEDPKQSFSNWLFSGDQNQWCGNFMRSVNGSDVNTSKLDPNTFIKNKLAEFASQDQCIDQLDLNEPSWRNITIWDPDHKKILSDNKIPYYWVIQEPSGSTYSNPTYGLPANNFAYSNIWSYENGTFGEFSMGLNYMFKTDDMVEGADNVFAYTQDNLERLSNILFNNNP